MTDRNILQSAWHPGVSDLTFMPEFAATRA
jgi:hypothetical protein